MILNESEVTERMSSPINLINRLRDAAVSGKRSVHNPHSIVSIPPKTEDIIPDIDEKLAFGSIKIKAAGIMIQAMDELKTRVQDAKTPSELAKIAENMSRIVNAEEEKPDRNRDNRPQIIFYAPQINQENNYETIYARE